MTADKLESLSLPALCSSRTREEAFLRDREKSRELELAKRRVDRRGSIENGVGQEGLVR